MQGVLAGPRAELGLTAAEINEAYSYRFGASISHRVTVLDTDDDPTGETIPVDKRAGGSVSWNYRPSDSGGSVSTSTTAVRRRASITLAGPVEVNVLARRYRVESHFMSRSGIWVPAYLGVFRAVLPAAADNGVYVTRQLEMTDKSGAWLEKSLDAPLEILGDQDVVQLVKGQLLEVFGEETTAFPTPPTSALEEPMFFDVNTPYLNVWNRAFKAIGLGQVIADEYGRPAANLLSDLANKGSEKTYGPGAGKMMRAGTLSSLIPTLPNVLKFTSRRGPSLPELGNGITYRRNQSYGPGSIDARGGEEVSEEITTDAYNHTELEAIANSDAQRYFAGGGDRYEGDIALNPLHSDQDVVTFNHPSLGLHRVPFNLTQWEYRLNTLESEADALMHVVGERRVIPEVVNA